MSSLMVKKKTLERIVCFLDSPAVRAYGNKTLAKLAPLFRYSEGYPDRLKMARVLFRLNARGVRARYAGDKAGLGEAAVKAAIPDFESELVMAFADYAAACKSMDCFLYQACEGNNGKMKEYRALEAARDLAYRVALWKTPEYNNAVWG